jgi:hypothetical protein
MVFMAMGVGDLPTVSAEPRDSTPSTGQLAPSQDLTLSGELLAIYGDPGAGSKLKHTVTYLLFDDQGQTTELEIDDKAAQPAGGPQALVKKRVQIEGEAAGPKKVKVKQIKPDKTKKDKLAAVASAAAVESTSAAAISGPQPWITILCRFGDATGVTPQPLSYFQGLMSGTAPGLNHYWREVSYNTVNLNGSLVVGWYNLSQPRSYYLPNGSLDFGRAATDCTAAADAAVYFPSFQGINLMFNQDLDCCAWGGAWGGSLDGQSKTYSMTWMPTWGWGNQSVMEHEMGHGFGLPHSSGPYGQTYDSQWDPMSNAWRCTPVHPLFGCVGPQTISYHKDRLGVIPPGDKYRVNASGTHTLPIAQSATTASVSDYLMAEVPIGCSAQFYTVESRRFVGYDGYLPAEAVVIHRVDTTLGDRLAQVVDSDGNGDPNDSGAMWLPGETFTDSASGISVAVNGSTPTGWNVTVNSPGGGDAYEPNNVWDEARLFTIGSTETHGFCFGGDEDWIYFSLAAGTPYRIETLNLASPSDTILELYDANLNLITSDDDGGGYPKSLINFTPTTTGNYYLKARQYGGGAAATYDLKISVVPQIANLLQNGSFEQATSGKPTIWSTNSKFVQTNEIGAVDGSYVGRFRATDNSGANTQQTVNNLTAGTNYRFSCWTNIPTTSDAFTYKYQVQWKNSSNSTISTWTVKTYSDDTAGAWNQATSTKLAPTGTVKAIVKLVASSLNGNIYVDHCVLAPA